MTVQKSHITLKYKEIDNGKKSIYLDYYKDGKRIREALHLYLLSEASKKNIIANKRTMKEAEAVRTERESELLAVRFGIETKEPSTMCIGEAIDKYEKIALDKGDTSSACNIRSMKKAVDAYRGLETKVVDVDESYCDGLVDFLHKSYTAQFGKISMTSARTYIYLFSSTLNNAVANGIIGVNPLRFVNIHGRITRERPLKKFLTVDEIKALMDTPCPVMSRPQVKQAFMLSIFTYLSSADVLSLKWKDIKTIEGRTTIEVHSRKSSVPLTAVSMRWLPETTNHRGLVFKGLPKDTEIRNILLKWGKNAGLEQPLSFRLAQNTFIYLLLITGTDIGTISCMLGMTPKTMKGYMKMVAATRIEDKEETVEIE
ncbi:site-specific integrase [Bacteroides fragilis]|uniref:tyrosine-type recombinase/integrase n=1 Tax=Bacteroides TaxID=816 RepID=UPI0036D4BB0F